MFHDYLNMFDTAHMRDALLDLFEVLDTPTDKRKQIDPFMSEALAAFPYVNGGLFTDSKAELRRQIPQFNDKCRTLLLKNASEEFDWSGISPTIFGAMFESTLNQETRRNGGMHYTSIENIHKVIDPLFLDDLKKELENILNGKQINVRKDALVKYRKKLGSLTFLDPACGSGNFLTLTYTELRKLENIALKQYLVDSGTYQEGMMVLVNEKDFYPIVVSVNNFYGIEINDFAVKVAQTALWIAESQMWEETKSIYPSVPDYLPLTSLPNIICKNALRIDWNDVIPSEKLSYIISNPPFVSNSGKQSDENAVIITFMTDEQKEDRTALFGDEGGILDYVACWYKKSSIIH